MGLFLEKFFQCNASLHINLRSIGKWVFPTQLLWLWSRLLVSTVITQEFFYCVVFELCYEQYFSRIIHLKKTAHNSPLVKEIDIYISNCASSWVTSSVYRLFFSWVFPQDSCGCPLFWWSTTLFFLKQSWKMKNFGAWYFRRLLPSLNV